MSLQYLALVSHDDEMEIVPVYDGIYPTAKRAKGACELDANDNGQSIIWNESDLEGKEEPHIHDRQPGEFWTGVAIYKDGEEDGQEYKYYVRPCGKE